MSVLFKVQIIIVKAAINNLIIFFTWSLQKDIYTYVLRVTTPLFILCHV